MKTILLKVLISIASIVLLVVHFLRPELKVDAITLGLLVLAVMPWLSHILQEAEFPGGWKVKFREVQEAGKKITDAVTETGNELVAKSVPLATSTEDPNLALVELRLELERRIRILARYNKIQDRGSLTRVLLDLKERGVLDESTTSGLEALIAAGNKAAKGAKVEREAAQWALNYGPGVLAALDRLSD